eukprot:SAG11_NODE_2260_length_3610_cov_3.120478_4_plen_156_part_00
MGKKHARRRRSAKRTTEQTSAAAAEGRVPRAWCTVYDVHRQVQVLGLSTEQRAVAASQRRHAGASARGGNNSFAALAMSSCSSNSEEEQADDDEEQLVAVVTACTPEPESDDVEPCVRVLSYNILAQSYFEQNTIQQRHCATASRTQVRERRQPL